MKKTIIGIGSLLVLGTSYFLYQKLNKKTSEQPEKDVDERKWYVDETGAIMNNRKQNNNVYSTPRDKYLESIRDFTFFHMLRKSWVDTNSYSEAIFKAGELLEKAEKKRKKKEPVGFVIQYNGISERFLFDSPCDLEKFKSLASRKEGFPWVEVAEVLHRIDLYATK